MEEKRIFSWKVHQRKRAYRKEKRFHEWNIALIINTMGLMLTYIEQNQMMINILR